MPKNLRLQVSNASKSFLTKSMLFLVCRGLPLVEEKTNQKNYLKYGYRNDIVDHQT